MPTNVSKHDMSDLHDHIGFWLRIVSNSVSNNFASELYKVRITIAEWVILRQMYKTNSFTSPTTISEKTDISKGAVSKLIERLYKKGLIIRNESSKDRRFKDIELTTKGASLVPRLSEIADKNDSFFFAALTKDDRNNLKRILKKLAIEHQLTKIPTE